MNKYNPQIAIIGTGARVLLGLINSLYDLRNRRSLINSNPLAHESDAYKKYAASPAAWSEDISIYVPQITALVNRTQSDLQKAQELCIENGDKPQTFNSLDELLSHKNLFDAVIVATPNDAHTQILLALLERKIPVLCEKPIATTLEEHDRIISAAQKSKSLFYVGFNLRSSPLFRRIHEVLEDGKIGKPMAVSCREVRGPFREGYRFDNIRSGGSLLEKNCHDFDLFNWHLGASPIKVSAFGGQHVLNKNTSIIDSASVIIEYDSGQIGTLELCMYAPFTQRGRTYELRGAQGVMRSPESPNEIDCFTFGSHTNMKVESEQFGSHSGGDMLQMLHFCKCLAGEEKPPATLLDAKKSAAIGIAAERAINENRIVEIDENFNLL